MGEKDIEAIVSTLKGKPKEKVLEVLKKMRLSNEDMNTVLERLGYKPSGKIFIPTDDLGYLMALANPTIRTGLKSLVLTTPWAPQVRSFVERIYDEFGSSDGPISREVIEFILLELGVPIVEAERLAKKAGELAQIEDHTQINYLIEEISRRAAKLIVNDYITQYANGKLPVKEFAKKVSELDSLTTYAHLPVMNIAEMTPSEVLKEYGGTDVIPSSFNFINQALPSGGYQRGQLVMVGAPPGTGKTTFLLNEAVFSAKHGNKVLYVSLGDMLPQDFFVKIIGIVKDLPVSHILMKIDELWRDKEVQEIARNLKISVLPAGSLTADQLYAAVSKKSTGEDYDVVIVDYDTNLKVEGDLSLYERGRLVYEALSAISRDEPYKLVFVASQVKRDKWGQDLIPLDAAADSSNKQAVVDLMLTIGKNPGKKKINDDSFVHAGYLNIAKARRGLSSPLSYTPYMLTASGRFIPITEARYQELYHREEEKRKRY